MADEIDVYQPCPCGSGKKIKFCCQPILGEMLRVMELRRSGQWQAALQMLDALDKREIREASSRAWVKSEKAMLLMSQSRGAEAQATVDEVLAESPEHPAALVIAALLRLQTESYPGAMRSVYKALRAADEAHASLASHLAMTMAGILTGQGHPLAAIEYLSLAMHLDGENEDLVELAASVQQNRKVPYPLRVHYFLKPLQVDGELQKRDETARRLSSRGCFSDAAKEFGQIARKNPSQPDVWWNIGLCHAWAGEDPLAVEAFKAAAANQTSVEAAAECLLLARLLWQPSPAARVEHLAQEFLVPHVSRLLTTLDRLPRVSRIPLPPAEADSDDDAGQRPAALYNILDRDLQKVPAAELSERDCATILGELSVFDAEPASGKPARAFLACDERERLNELVALLRGAAPELEPANEPQVIGWTRRELSSLVLRWKLPDEAPPALADRVERARRAKVVEEIWPNTPQEFLNGKTPAQAAAVPELRAAVEAAVLALEAFVEQDGFSVDVEQVREKLGLPAAAPFAVAETDDPLRFSILQIRRLALKNVTDNQLVRLLGVFAQLGLGGQTERAMREALARPSLSDKLDTPRLCLSLAELARRNRQHDEALSWLVKGKEASRARRAPLNSLLLWELEELALRARDPDDPQVLQLAANLWNYYRPKLPDAAAMIAGLLNELNLPGPWNAPPESIAAADMPATAGVSAGGIWTPEAPAPAGEPSKLWLPGQ
ncbi:MAG: tetratricopeptide repeat protein [Planctomycetaceae bacterium]